MEKAYQITVKGRVQGVGFRYFAAKRAQALGLKGFVKNTNDGNVYIEAQGQEDQLIAFVEEIKKGPILSRVDKMIVNENILQDFSTFEVR
jgi:acylphosphatase